MGAMLHINPHGYWSGAGVATEHRCSPRLAGWLTHYLDRSVPTYDFGCGLGTYLLALHQVGFERLHGYEGDPPPIPHFGGIERHDLTEPLEVEEPGNVICLEVAEHVPEEHSATLLQTVTRACADKLVFSWAIRGQGGAGHVHELDFFESYPLLEARGFAIDVAATREARDLAGADLSWFRQSIMICRRRALPF